MTDALPKNKNPKLKWWQKGALVGFGIALITLIIVVPVVQARYFFAGSGIMILLVELPVLPIFVLVGYFLSTLGYSIILQSLGTTTFLLTHFISWTLGGIIYAGIFHTIRRLTKHSPLGIGIGAGIGYLIDRIKWKKILIIAALIAVGVMGYHWYQTSQRPAPPKELPVVSPTTEEPVIGEEIADWKIHRNEEYGYEIKYPQDWKIVNVDWTAGREYVQFLSPLIDNKYYFVLNFGARNKGDNTQISYQPDEDWELLKSFMRLGDKVKIGNVDVLTTEIVEKGKVHSILYSNRLGAGRVEISDLEIQVNSGFIEGSQHLSASDVESIDLKNLPELKLANQILSTFKFIEEEDKTVQISVFVDMESFDLVNKTFESWWASNIGEKIKVKIIITGSTEFYRTSEPTWEKEYFTFSELYSKTVRTWPLTVKGVFEKEDTIKASEVFIIIQ